MNRISLFFPICVFFSVCIFNPIFAQNPVVIIPEKIYSFEIGKGETQYDYVSAINKDEYTRPGPIRILKDGTIVVFDPAANSEKYYSSSMVFLESKKFNSSEMLYDDLALASSYIKTIIEDTNYYAVISGFQAVIWFDVNRNYIGYSTADPLKFYSASVIKKVAFFWDDKNNIYCNIEISKKSQEENISKLLNERSLREYLMQKGNSLPGVSLDEKGILYVDGKPFLDNPLAYIKYYSSIDPGWLKDGKKGKEFWGDYKLGEDKVGRTFWGSQDGGIVIMNKDAMLEKVYYAQPNDTIIWGIPAIHPNGDVYLLGFQQDGKTSLYRIKKAW